MKPELQEIHNKIENLLKEKELIENQLKFNQSLLSEARSKCSHKESTSKENVSVYVCIDCGMYMGHQA